MGKPRPARKLDRTMGGNRRTHPHPPACRSTCKDGLEEYKQRTNVPDHRQGNRVDPDLADHETPSHRTWEEWKESSEAQGRRGRRWEPMEGRTRTRVGPSDTIHDPRRRPSTVRTSRTAGREEDPAFLVLRGRASSSSTWTGRNGASIETKRIGGGLERHVLPSSPRRNKSGPTPPRTHGIAVRNANEHRSQRTRAAAFAIQDGGVRFRSKVRNQPCPSRTSRPVGPRRAKEPDPSRPFGSSERDPPVDRMPKRMRHAAISPLFLDRTSWSVAGCGTSTAEESAAGCLGRDLRASFEHNVSDRHQTPLPTHAASERAPRTPREKDPGAHTRHGNRLGARFRGRVGEGAPSKDEERLETDPTEYSGGLGTSCQC
eukprot:scaffold516_cov307-Pavlova_lutheri.AAC.1